MSFYCIRLQTFLAALKTNMQNTYLYNIFYIFCHLFLILIYFNTALAMNSVTM